MDTGAERRALDAINRIPLESRVWNVTDACISPITYVLFDLLDHTTESELAKRNSIHHLVSIDYFSKYASIDTSGTLNQLLDKAAKALFDKKVEKKKPEIAQYHDNAIFGRCYLHLLQNEAVKLFVPWCVDKEDLKALVIADSIFMGDEHCEAESGEALLLKLLRKRHIQNIGNALEEKTRTLHGRLSSIETLADQEILQLSQESPDDAYGKYLHVGELMEQVEKYAGAKKQLKATAEKCLEKRKHEVKERTSALTSVLDGRGWYSTEARNMLDNIKKEASELEHRAHIIGIERSSIDRLHESVRNAFAYLRTVEDIRKNTAKAMTLARAVEQVHGSNRKALQHLRTNAAALLEQRSFMATIATNDEFFGCKREYLAACSNLEERMSGALQQAMETVQRRATITARKKNPLARLLGGWMVQNKRKTLKKIRQRLGYDSGIDASGQSS